MDRVKEVVFVSGKGGVGKTSIVGAVSCFLDGVKVIVDCDVDAANLFLILGAEIIDSEDFIGGKKPKIRGELCTKCGICKDICEFGAISPEFLINHVLCEGCGACFVFCPEAAISFSERKVGTLFRAFTKNKDPFVYGELLAGEENSGKLVQKVRERAQEEAMKNGAKIILIDGPPGIGCPVISSITGCDLAVAISEPTPTSFYDLSRLLDLTKHFGIKTALIINRSDVNTYYTEKLKIYAEEKKLVFLGDIPYDSSITEAQKEGKTIAELDKESFTYKQIKNIGEKLYSILEDT